MLKVFGLIIGLIVLICLCAEIIPSLVEATENNKRNRSFEERLKGSPLIQMCAERINDDVQKKIATINSKSERVSENDSVLRYRIEDNRIWEAGFDLRYASLEFDTLSSSYSGDEASSVTKACFLFASVLCSYLNTMQDKYRYSLDYIRDASIDWYDYISVQIDISQYVQHLKKL